MYDTKEQVENLLTMNSFTKNNNNNNKTVQLQLMKGIGLGTF